jgi:heparanase 1
MRWANFADSLWYADSLAAKAANGYSVYCRQDLVGIDYGLLDCSTHEPLPDYWTAVLFHRLMGEGVFEATLTDVHTRPNTAAATPLTRSASISASTAGRTSVESVRAYAHCSRGTGAAIEPSTEPSITLLLINLDRAANATIYLNKLASPSSGSLHLTEWHLKAGDFGGNFGTAITLNGVPLVLNSNGTLPALNGREAASTTSSIELSPASIAFVEVTGAAGSSSCGSY